MRHPNQPSTWFEQFIGQLRNNYGDIDAHERRAKNSCSKYKPHQGAQECARRGRQRQRIIDNQMHRARAKRLGIAE